jgi:hypothetical protein
MNLYTPLFAIAIALASCSSTSSSGVPGARNEVPTQQINDSIPIGDTSKVEVESTSKTELEKIPGFSFTALQSSLRSKGFTFEESCSTDEQGKKWCEWNFDKEIGNDRYNVTVFGDSKSSVQQVEILANYEDREKSQKGLFKMIASLKYKGAEPQKALAWLEANFTNHGARTQIGGVKFLIFTKTAHSTFLILTVGNDYDV